MTEYDDEFSDDQENDSPAIQALRKQNRELEKQAKEASETAAKAEVLERKLAFLEAGIPNTKAAEYFVNGYKGDLAPEAIQAEAREVGLLPPAEPEVPADEFAAHDKVAGASAGTGNDVDREQMLRDTGGDPDKIMPLLQSWGVQTSWDANA